MCLKSTHFLRRAAQNPAHRLHQTPALVPAGPRSSTPGRTFLYPSKWLSGRCLPAPRAMLDSNSRPVGGSDVRPLLAVGEVAERVLHPGCLVEEPVRPGLAVQL